MDTRLEAFVRDSLAKGVDRDAIAAAAKRSGWSDGEITSALGAWTDDDGYAYLPGIPVPKRIEKQGSDFFFYLVRFSACYACLWAVMDLVFASINRIVPDPNAWAGSYAYETRWSVAAMTVVLPLYIRMLVMNARMLKADPTRWESGWRRFFFGLTRYVSGMTAAGCAITLIGGILAFKGNLNDGLQLGAVIVMCAILHFDYQSPLKPTVSPKAKSTFMWLALAATLALYVSGLAFALQHREPVQDQPPAPVPTKPLAP